MSSHRTTSVPSHGRSPAWSRLGSTLALVLLCACSSAPLKPPPPAPLPTPPAPVLPAPQAVELEDVTWRVIPGDVPLYALDTRGYEALSRDLGELARWMSEASWQLEFYRSSRQPAPTPEARP